MILQSLKRDSGTEKYGKEQSDPCGENGSEQPMKLAVRTPGLIVDARGQFTSKLVHLSPELAARGVKVGAELCKRRLDQAQALVDLLIGALQMGDANLQRIGHGTIVTQPAAPSTIGCCSSFPYY